MSLRGVNPAVMSVSWWNRHKRLVAVKRVPRST
jgi:hypothetical protein